MFDSGRDLSVLPQPHSTMIDQYLLERMEERLAALPWPGSRVEWERMLPELRRRLLGSLGFPDGLPAERPPVRAVERGVLKRAGYRIERLLLETRPGWWVPAHAYVPDEEGSALEAGGGAGDAAGSGAGRGAGRAAPRSGRRPAVLCPHGHWDTAKASLHVQTRCVQLARLGFIALAVDMAGYGERRRTGHRETTYLWASGLTLSGVQFWDNVRALDYLAARADVDATRLGCTGASGGGNQTMILSAVDERVKAAVPVCSVENFRSYFEKGFCECETYPGVLGFADHPHILAMIAPRALCIVNGTLDVGFPVHRARRTFRQVRKVYEWYDPERVEYVEFYGPHGYERTAREAAYRWFSRWLKDAGDLRDAGDLSDRPIQEPPLVLEPPQGPPLHEGDGRTDAPDPGDAGGPVQVPSLAALHRVTAERLVAQARRTPWSKADFEAMVLGDFEGRFPAPTPRTYTLGAETMPDGIRVERWVLEPERGILLPLLVLRRTVGGTAGPADSREVAATRWLIVLTPQAKTSLPFRRDFRLLLDAGWTVAALDVRATGETAPAGGGPWVGQRCAMLGLSLVGMQAWDLSAAVSHVVAESRAGAAAGVAPAGAPATSPSVWVYAEGTFALTGLIGALLDERVAGAGLVGLPASLAVEGAAGQPRGVLPFGFLRFGDVADLAARLGPRRLVVGGLLDASGRPLPPESVRGIFSPSERGDAEGQFLLLAGEEGVLPALTRADGVPLVFEQIRATSAG